MPEELYAGLSMPEFVDLIAYMATLKLPETATASHHGMPPEIPGADGT